MKNRGLKRLEKGILEELKIDPSMKQIDIAKKLNVSRQSIVVNVRKLKQDGILERVGKIKNGYWKINEENIDM